MIWAFAPVVEAAAYCLWRTPACGRAASLMTTPKSGILVPPPRGRGKISIWDPLFFVVLTAGLMIDFALHTQGTTQVTLCIGRYALKFARGQRGYIANCGEQVEWKRATPERWEVLCPLLRGCAIWFGQRHETGSPPDTSAAPRASPKRRLSEVGLHAGRPSSPLEHEASDWGYLDGRLVALDYPAIDVEG
jgi:hypothetical protein